MKTIEDYLVQNAALYPNKTAIVCGDETVTYFELLSLVLQKINSYKEQTCAQRFVVIKASQTINFLAHYFAIHLSGLIAVPLEHDVTDENLAYVMAKLKDCTHFDDTADILFTTGTTGHAKGVMISKQTIVANTENLIEAQGFRHETTFVVCGPLNHIGSLSKIYPIIYLGGTLIILEGLKDMEAFYHALDYPSPCMATFLVPASIRMILRFSSNRLASYADKIDFIETGAAPISKADMASLCEVLPTSRLYNTYASTETGIISTYNFNDGKCLQGCLGRPMKHSGFLIMPGGTIACTGKTLMQGYAADAVLTESTLHDSMLVSSDNGYIDEEGRLHINGRNDDIINVGGYKVAPTEIENAALGMEEIKDCVCIGFQHPVLGNALKLLIVMDDKDVLDKKRIAMFLKSKLESYKVPNYYERVDSIRRTFNGKIDRKFYSIQP